MKGGPAEKFERAHVRPAPGRTLIVGSKLYEGREDRRQRYPKAVGIDMLAGPGVDIVADMEDPPDLGKFAHVECCSVLEHSRRPWLLAAHIEDVMLPGATLFVSVPWVWRFHSFPSDYWRVSPEGLKALFNGIDWRHVGIASNKLRSDTYLQAKQIDGYPYLPRSETVGFGVRK